MKPSAAQPGIGVVHRLVLAARAEAMATATGDDQRTLATQQRPVLGDAIVEDEIEGHPEAHDLVDPGLQAAGHAEVVHRRGDHQQVAVEEFADQLVAQRQIGLHRQRTLFRLGMEGGGNEGLGDRRKRYPADFAARHAGLRMGFAIGRQENLGETPGLRALASRAGMHCENSTHLYLLGFG